jgi:hypothetical protein
LADELGIAPGRRAQGLRMSIVQDESVRESVVSVGCPAVGLLR